MVELEVETQRLEKSGVATIFNIGADSSHSRVDLIDLSSVI
jgi:hypothetical protein